MSNRRDFLKTSLLGTAAVAATTMAGSVQAAPSDKDKKAYDLVIIGAGMGGFCCAIRAKQNGLRPILIEKMPMPAGNTIYAAGFVLGVHSRPQEAANCNKDDSVEKFYEDMLKVSKGRGDKALSRYVAENLDSTIAWLEDYVGMKFRAGMKLAYPMLQRAMLPVGDVKPGGNQLAVWLMAKCKELGIPVRFNTKAIKLIIDDDTGAVKGVVARTKEKTIKLYGRYGTVIATGGYSANNMMVIQNCGVAAANMPIRGSRVVSGENITLAQAAFAKFVNVDQYHCGPIYGPTGANPLNIVNNGIAVSMDKTERYTNEGLTYVQMSRDTAALTKNNWACIIIDQDTRDLKKLAPDFASYRLTKAPIYQADTIEELAKAAGLDPVKLVKIVDEYNKAIKEGTRDKLTPPNTLPEARPVLKAPFYAVPFQGGMTATFGGPLINTEARVLNNENRVIPGLFAIGNAAGGLFYDDYIGGAQLSSAAIFGIRVADVVKQVKAEARK